MPRRFYIVSYDIRDRKRWRRVFALMDRRGEHRQLSVFLVKTDNSGLRSLVNALAEIIDPTEDSVIIAAVGRSTDSQMIELGAKGPMPGAEVLII
ncbi:CRISPR-associated endonuclease Cas2 [uncultured Aliiroseovarius sp.]|uniref:CRISPR-associated endonuclease Cas2 n=1 Tax=uncultured Aliiroseovarius sp. TaxID=1658783 RepID=UPI00262E5F02|nr:CRISPR-associated endonuclease Cas2 [uncultured Aliiroseovarius sp.]